ncbi:MAG: efflux RND transporter periplasmic adaptor subunit [Alphaproteobacteria bacterium]|nr:efflux RND transporter periplasmic adaptor subunit [Alphaproteobacteria bacterium]
MTSQSEAASQTTGAIGQIVPEGGIVGVMGAPGSLAAEILVHTSQQVKAGTLLMRTRAGTPDTDPAQVRKQLAVVQELAEQQLAAQTADVTLAQSRYDQAKKQLATYQALGTSITSKKELDALTVAAGDAATALVAEQARLKAIKTQNQSNLGVARRQLEAAVQGTELRAPVDGTILKINRHVGERLGNDPAVQLGNLSAMYVICQIYEGDLLRLKPGMTATVTARPLPQPLHGHIEEIGRLVDTQSRLGEVRIRLDRADPASRLVGMQVDVAIAR